MWNETIWRIVCVCIWLAGALFVVALPGLAYFAVYPTEATLTVALVPVGAAIACLVVTLIACLVQGIFDAF